MSKGLVTRHLKNAKEIRKYGICPPYFESLEIEKQYIKYGKDSNKSVQQKIRS